MSAADPASALVEFARFFVGALQRGGLLRS